jgi:hypothetical protein
MRLKTHKRWLALKAAAKTTALVVVILLAYGVVGSWDFEEALAADARATSQIAKQGENQ